MDICQSCWQTDGTAEFIQGIPFCILFVDGQHNKDTIENNLAVKMTVFFCAWQYCETIALLTGADWMPEKIFSFSKRVTKPKIVVTPVEIRHNSRHTP